MFVNSDTCVVDFESPNFGCLRGISHYRSGDTFMVDFGVPHFKQHLPLSA